MRHCDDVLVFMIGMLLCVIIAVVVILLIASPSFREGERILTPVGEEKVQNVKRRAASVAARAEQETSRSAEAVKAAVRNRRRTDEDAPAEPTPDGNVETADSIPIDGDVVEDRTIHLAKVEREKESAAPEPATAAVPRTGSQPTQQVDLKAVPAPAATSASTGSTPYRPVATTSSQPVATAATMQNQPVVKDAPDRLWVDEDDEFDDDVPEHFEPATIRVAQDEAPEAADSAQDEAAEPEPVLSSAVTDTDDEDEPTDGGFFSRITYSLNRSSTDRSRTGPRHARS